MTSKILAKSPINGGTLLTDHTKMVLNLGYTIAKKYPYSNESNLKELMVALILHDIGKCSSQYQKFLKDGGECDDEDVEIIEPKKKFFFHNTISWAFAETCIKGIRPSHISRNYYKHYPILSSILYHHTIRDKDNETVTADYVMSYIIEDGDTLSIMGEFYLEMCDYVKNTFGIDILSDPDYTLNSEPVEYGHSLKDEMLFIDKTKCKNLGEYFNYTSLSFKNRAILNYADRLVSSRNYDNDLILSNDYCYIETILNNRINRCPIEYDLSKYDYSRLKIQMDTIDECILNDGVNTNVICASAGFGKTLMGILTYLKYNKKTLWVLPTISLCDSTYKSVVDELETLNIQDKVNVGLFYSNEFKRGDENSDIIILGVDALLGRLSKNNLSGLFLDALTSNVIFDEYHEFLMNEPLFAGFVDLVKTRKDYMNVHTFLLSATPLNLNNLWGSNKIRYWKDMPIYGGDIKVEIHYVEEDTLEDATIDFQENSVTIFPTVDTAQQAYMNSDMDLKLIHSRFLPDDKMNNLNNVFAIYGKKSKISHKTPLLGTNIIGTGFNISARILNDYIITPMRTIQTIGRGARFGEYDKIVYNVITSNMKSDVGIRKLIESCASMSMRTRWIDCLKKYDGSTISKNELYDIYNDFMDRNKKEWDIYINQCFGYSSNNLMKIRYVSGNYKKDSDEKISRSYTYRGESSNFYATVRLDDGTYLEPIVCDVNIRFKDDTDSNDRYKFMTSGEFDFPSKEDLKYKWGIKKNEATFEKCLGLARSKSCPILLNDFKYRKDIGLYRNNE